MALTFEEVLKLRRANGFDLEMTAEEEEDFRKEWERGQAIFEAEQYIRDREAQYPSIQDQLDYIYHNSITKWKSDMIKPVKDAHPKPE